MENIGNFLRVAESLGVAKMDLFQTVDLYEAQNIPGVIFFIYNLNFIPGKVSEVFKSCISIYTVLTGFP